MDSRQGDQIWKVYGPDLNGSFGGLQGTGGLEAVILDADGTTTGVINDLCRAELTSSFVAI